MDQILASCPTDEERIQIDRDFKITYDPEIFMPYECKYVPGLENEPGANPVLLTNAQLSVYQAFRITRSMSFDAPLPWTNDSLYDWLRESIEGVHFAERGPAYCCKEERVIVIGGLDLTHPRMRSWVLSGALAIVNLMVHEGRHAEGFPHTCLGWDDSLGGAFGTTQYLHRWVAEHSIPGFFTQLHIDEAARIAGSQLRSAICHYDVTFVDAQKGWVAGGWGRILHTDDGGTTWSVQSDRFSIPARLNDVTFVDDQRGWAVGTGAAFHTTDGGVTWSSIEASMAADLPPNPKGGSSLGALYTVVFVGAERGWVVTFGAIHHTADGGATWAFDELSQCDVDSFLQLQGGMAFADSQHGLVVSSYGAIVETADGGATWTCRTIWSTDSGNPPWLQDIVFTDPSNGWIVGGQGLILHTSDGGITWSQQESGVTADLFGVAFVDAQRGWAVGENGAILHTRDGGMTWIIQDSGATSFLWDVAFVSEQEGWVVGDGGLILHTEDGGSSWVVQREP